MQTCVATPNVTYTAPVQPRQKGRRRSCVTGVGMSTRSHGWETEMEPTKVISQVAFWVFITPGWVPYFLLGLPPGHPSLANQVGQCSGVPRPLSRLSLFKYIFVLLCFLVSFPKKSPADAQRKQHVGHTITVFLSPFRIQQPILWSTPTAACPGELRSISRHLFPVT